MQGMKALTRQDLIDLVDKTFPEAHENDVIATLFYCSAGNKEPQQQAILFQKEIPDTIRNY